MFRSTIDCSVDGVSYVQQAFRNILAEIGAVVTVVQVRAMAENEVSSAVCLSLRPGQRDAAAYNRTKDGQIGGEGRRFDGLAPA